MRTLPVVVVVCLLVAASAFAQEQRGSIEGVVKDSSGAVLPGVTVEARSPALVGVSTAITDAHAALHHAVPRQSEHLRRRVFCRVRCNRRCQGDDGHPTGSEVWAAGSVAEPPD